MKIEKLENHIEITSGQIMSRITAEDNGEDVAGAWRIIVPKAITSDGFIDVEELAEEKLKAIPDTKRVTELNDIVIKLSTPFDAAIITEETVGCVVPSFCAIIRNKETLDLDYLMAYLSSKYCKEQLRARVTGAIMSILSIGKIKEIDVPVPSEEKQREIGRSFKRVQEKKHVIKQILELETKRNDIIFQELLK